MVPAILQAAIAGLASPNPHPGYLTLGQVGLVCVLEKVNAELTFPVNVQ